MKLLGDVLHVASELDDLLGILPHGYGEIAGLAPGHVPNNFGEQNEQSDGVGNQKDFNSRFQNFPFYPLDYGEISASAVHWTQRPAVFGGVPLFVVMLKPL
jgi:hypothetical protein